MGGPSASEQELQAEQAAATAQYMHEQTVNYGEQQQLFASLQPLLMNEINNPVGFNATELAELNASNINTTGAQYANVQKQLNLRNASANMAGLTSGVSAAETAALQNAAAGTVATNASNIQLQSAQLAQQKQQTAQAQLEALEANAGGQAVSMGQVENQSENQAFQQAYTMQQQSSQMLSGILGGLVNAGIGAATGGLGTMMQGGGFLEGAGQALAA